MENYDPKLIEPKWQEFWAKHPELCAADNASDKPKKYILDMFPYPSGDGLHVGHVESYTATDIISRFSRMKGFNVLHPQGWDAFGLPAENYAIKTKIHPQETTKKAIATFKGQMNKLGLSYDWSREVNSSDSEYYKWTQWFFLLLYRNGLAYKKKANVNWCPKCQTVLANEQAEGGVCERCKTEVVQKDLEQWFFKITDFIEKNKNTAGLIEGLGKVDWPESIKAAQKNWIGKSTGAQFKMQISGTEEFIEVYTTRVDTVFGMMYAVIAPEHKTVQKLKDRIENWDEVEKYLIVSQNKTELERMELKDKTGVELKGVKLKNPFNKEEVPLFVADYVLAHYGTGAVMAVPAHDERDFEFAKKYNLKIKEVVVKKIGKRKKNAVWRDGIFGVVTFNDKVLILYDKKFNLYRLPGGGLKDNEDEQEALRREIIEETGYKNFEIKKYLGQIEANYFAIDKKEERHRLSKAYHVILKDDSRESQSKEDIEKFELKWKSSGDVLDTFRTNTKEWGEDEFISRFLSRKELCFTDDGALVNSEKYSGLTSEEAREKMTTWLEKEKIGERKINYKLRDWLISRQRYWGAPIPIIYCEKCGEVPIPEEDLPVVLPTDVDFKPTGESPLNYSETFQNVKCPKCGARARRESDTMDTFVCSSWYYFRYTDPKNEKEFASKEAIKKWLPVDLYVGGAEHAVLHLLYARFFTKVLHNLGHVNFDEPFLKLRNQGIILAEDGRKMSKSLGNVVNPDSVIEEFGADSLRMFEMFMGPLEDAKPWNTKGIVGIKRFLEKVWKLQARVSDQETANNKINNLLHKTIKKVGEDIEDFKFNTAISAMMILVNEMEKGEKLPVADFQLLISILSPFAPHIAEELWNKLGNKNSIFVEKWPEYDPELIKDEKIVLVVQVNGKVRDSIEVDAEISEAEAKELAMQSEKIKTWVSGKEIKKVIFVKNKLINIVVS